jgi:hypothetical protein
VTGFWCRRLQANTRPKRYIKVENEESRFSWKRSYLVDQEVAQTGMEL